MGDQLRLFPGARIERGSSGDRAGIERLELTPGAPVGVATFPGRTFHAPTDGKRLTSQLEAVRAALESGRRWRLDDLRRHVSIALGRSASESSIGAKIRVLRQQPHGLAIRSARVHGGVWEYWLTPDAGRRDVEASNHG